MGFSVMTITDAAAGRVKQLLAKGPEDALGLRLGVKARGCNGQSYVVDYATEQKPGDEIVNDKGVTVFIDAAAVLMLFGTEMDYKEDKFESGFTFRNPNEKGRCGCGESFHV